MDTEAAWLYDNYVAVREVPTQGVCALGPLAFTTGLFCGLQEWGYKYRYCYADVIDALAAIETWDGTGHPEGPWIVRKGKGGDLRNKAHPDYDPRFD